MPNKAPERAHGIRYACYKDPAGRQGECDAIKGIEYFCLCEMLKKIKGSDRRQISAALLENGPVISLSDLRQSRCASYGYLFSADIDTLGIVPIR